MNNIMKQKVKFYRGNNYKARGMQKCVINKIIKCKY